MSETTNKRNKTNRRPNSKANVKQDQTVEFKSNQYDNSRGNTKKGMNDVSWYAKNPQLLIDAASIPYSYPTGQPISRYDEAKKYFKEAPAMPGICAVGLIPTYGTMRDANSSINVAANSVYTFVRHLNSGHSNYDATDLMLYLMAMDEAYAMISWAQRVYGTISMYQQLNRYVPDSLLKAQHVDPNNIRTNIAQFRAGLNIRIQKLASLCVPNNMPIFLRHAWLYSNIYTEGDSWKDQLYLYTPVGYRYFSLNTDGSGMLKYQDIGLDDVTLYTVDDIFANLDKIINPLIADEDIGIMSGDILKAYGESGIWRLSMIPEDYAVTPVFNKEVLEQFHNATVVRFSRLNEALDITQDVPRGVLKMANQFTIPSTDSNLASEANIVAYSLTRPALITTESASPTPAITMVNTRLTVVGRDVKEATVPTDDAKITMDLASEIAAFAKIYTGYRNSQNNLITQVYTYYSAIIQDATGTLVDWNVGRNYIYGSSAFISFDANFAHFKYAPGFTPISYIEVGGTKGFFPCPWDHKDIDNYAVIDEATLASMHSVAVLSEFNVPYSSVTK